MKYVINGNTLTGIADSIRAKLGESNLYTPSEMPDAISRISGSAAQKNDVTFYDYDGTIIAGYSADEFSVLTGLPENPSHDGLIAQGWNWSLENAKAYAAKYGKLNIGQMYVTNDGSTRIYVSLGDGKLTPRLYLNVTGTVTIDWGDGSAEDTLSSDSYVDHAYAAEGDYVIRIKPGAGTTFSFGVSATRTFLRDPTAEANPTYACKITKVEIGSGMSELAAYAFYNCYAMQAVMIPVTVEIIQDNAFHNCYSLRFAVIPDSVSAITSTTFFYCYSLAAICFSDSSISLVNSTFANCYSLQEVWLPENITSIGARTFNTCYALAAVIIPDSIESLSDWMFAYCYSLRSVHLPSGLKSIGKNTFNYCAALASITLPASLVSIEVNAFQYAYIGKLTFLSAEPPAAVANAFSGLPITCEIHVPAGTLNAYKTATNYPNPSTYTYIEDAA